MALVAVLGFGSLAVDFGRVQCARAEIRTAADAAARAAATGIGDGSAFTKAAAIASQNLVDGTSLVLTAADVVVGNWSSSNNTFTAGGSPSNAVRVDATRCSSRGTAVPLSFARVIGMPAFDIHASTIVTSGSSANIFLTSIAMNASSRIDSYNSAVGPYSAGSAGNSGNVQTNGNVTLGSSASIYGDARPGVAKSVVNPGSGAMTGSTTPLTQAVTLAPPPPLTGPYIELGALVRNGTGSEVMPGGVYHASSVNIGGNYVVSTSGPVTLYVDGAFTMNSTSTLPIGSNPADLKIYLTGTANLNLGGSINLYAQIYGPKISATINSSAQLYGSLNADKLIMSGSGQLHIDESAGSSSGVRLVR